MKKKEIRAEELRIKKAKELARKKELERKRKEKQAAEAKKIGFKIIEKNKNNANSKKR